MRVYEEIVDFIAGGASSLDVANFEASDAMKQHVADLIHREKTVGLDADETEELNQFLQAEHIMRLAKARARQRLSHE